MDEMRTMMRRFTVALNIMEEAYCCDVTKLGTKESELWLLYALDDGKEHSQRQLCEEWGFPKTTLNSTIKRAEAEGNLILTAIPGKKRERNICLTEKGKKHAETILKTIYAAEDQAMEATLKEYSSEFIDAVEFFSERLNEALRGGLSDMEKTR